MQPQQAAEEWRPRKQLRQPRKDDIVLGFTLYARAFR